ncbi:hypothetical protein Taro_022067 [Colocasia esculenta]|uniref:Uncharacterized protein n=1 Tax=Colocasia esculenta TaxID=4460 RepID=A0A843V6U8_COLES|nr:hypothetical protein [Colocasia esculenta]
MHTVSLGSSPSPRWVASQQPSYPSAVPPSGFLVQQAPSNISQVAPTSLLQPGHQQLGGFSGEGVAFGASKTLGIHLSPKDCSHIYTYIMWESENGRSLDMEEQVALDENESGWM